MGLNNDLINIVKGFALFLLLTVSSGVYAQKGRIGERTDTVHIKNNQILVLKDDIIVPQHDTAVVLLPNTKYKIKKNPYVSSESFYKSLERKYSGKKLTRDMYRFLIVRGDQNMTDSVQMYNMNETFRPYQGKQISRILYGNVDLFEGNVNDTLKVAVTRIGKSLNKLHVNTRHRVIRKNLVFEEGDLLDPDQMSDNERILRHLPFIQDALIQVVPDSSDPESVVVIVVTQDKFPWGADPDMQDIDRFGLRLTHSNVAGYGHQAYVGMLTNLKDTISPFGYELGYRVDNIAGSFITGRVDFLNAQGRKWLGIGAKRDFLTPQTKWGGAMSFDIHRDDSTHIDHKDTVIFYQYSANFYDYWMGRSFLMKQSKRKRIVLSARYVNKFFIDQPYVEADSNLAFHNKSFVLGSIQLLQKDYYKSSLIHNFGRAEDIPFGYLVKVTGGYIDDEFYKRPYIGFEVGWAHFFEGIGYFGVRANTGGFLYNQGINDVLLKARGSYISPISVFGIYRIRQLGKLYYSLSASDFSSQFVKYNKSIEGLNERGIWGKSALSVGIENVVFTPWFFYGFRFAPFASLDMGVISKNKSVFKNPDFHAGISLGLRVFNESLSFNQIDIRITYFINNGGNSSAVRFDFATNKEYIKEIEGSERPVMVNELYR